MHRVLYVDDEPALLELGKVFLERSGVLRIEMASSAEDAIKKIKNKAYDGIISDYQMPEMDGIAFLKYIRVHYERIPFILFTGRGREEVVIEALNSGADFYLQKGGDPKSQFVELEHKIRLAIERRQTADELSESRQRMTDIIDHLPDATFAIDVNGTVIAWNRAMEEMTGVNTEQILGTGDHSYAVPFYGMRRPILLDLVLREDKETERKYPHIIRKDNKLISEISIPLLYGGKGAYLWFIASPLYDTHRNLVGAIESIRDITDRKNSEEALKESEERYRAVVEDQTEFITRFLPDGTHVFVNDAYCRYFKKTPAEFIGTTFTPQLSAEDQKAVRQHIRGLTKENPVATLEHRFIMPDGQIRWQQWSDRAIFDEQGNLVEYQSVGRDITDRKMAEDGLKTAYMQITASEEELREQYDEVRKRQDALRESEENYRALFDEAADLIVIVDLHGTFLNLNKKFEEESGYQQEEMMGKNVLTYGIVTAPSAAKIAFHLGQLILGKNPPLFEIEGVA
ncbi:MAG: PAS domain S-box protein, partial [Methanoregula sp.]|nr:PAS domain S-box protein [Methanoregula sp.]